MDGLWVRQSSESELLLSSVPSFVPSFIQYSLSCDCTVLWHTTADVVFRLVDLYMSILMGDNVRLLRQAGLTKGVTFDWHSTSVKQNDQPNTSDNENKKKQEMDSSADVFHVHEKI